MFYRPTKSNLTLLLFVSLSPVRFQLKYECQDWHNILLYVYHAHLYRLIHYKFIIPVPALI